MRPTVSAALQASDGTWHPLAGRSLFARPALQSDDKYYHRLLHAEGPHVHVVFEDGWPVAYELWTDREWTGGAALVDGAWRESDPTVVGEDAA